FLCPDVANAKDASVPCAGPADPSEGPMVNVQSETDVQAFPRSARTGPLGHPTALDHYKVHDLNSTSHIDTPYTPWWRIISFFGFDPPLSRQNPIERSPVLRADLVNLVDKIRHDTPLPASAYIEAHSP